MKSKILQKDHEEMIAISKKMTPGERLLAFLKHSQLVSQIYQAGVDMRKKSFCASSTKQKNSAKS